MNYLFEESNILKSPYEAFLFDAKHNVFPITSHWHYFMEIILISKGSAIINCNHKEFTLEEGDLILIHPQVVHSIFTSSPCPLKYYVLKFDIGSLNAYSVYTGRISTVFKCAEGSTKAPILIPFDEIKDLYLEDLFKSCISEVNRKDYGYDIRIESIISSLLIEIIRVWRRQGFDLYSTKIRAYDKESLYTVLKYIDDHTHEVIRVEELAKMCHMSYSYFAKKFRELYGQSCKDYIEFIKISKVKDLLLFTNFDLNYISQETGFSDCSHLIRIFKKNTGITPNKFRAKHIVTK